MRHRRFFRAGVPIFFAWLVAALLSEGCATRGKVSKQEPPRARNEPLSETRRCNASYGRVWQAAVEAIPHSDLVLVSADKQTGIILLRQLASERTLGENLDVHISPANETETVVQVQTRHVGPRQFGWSHNAQKVFDGIARNLTRDAGSPEPFVQPVVGTLRQDLPRGIVIRAEPPKEPGLSRAVKPGSPAPKQPQNASVQQNEPSVEELLQRERRRRDAELDQAEIQETQERLEAERYLLRKSGQGDTVSKENPPEEKK